MTMREPEPERKGNGEAGMEIGSGRRRRVVGWLSYLLLFGVVAGALVLVFVQFTGSKTLAVGLVGFMVAYMAVMGWMASRKT